MRRHFAFAGSVGYALTLLPGSGCSRTEPCPLRDRAELIDRIDESKPARPRTIQIATAWAAEANVPAALAPKIAQAVEQQGQSFAFFERLLAVAASSSRLPPANGGGAVVSPRSAADGTHERGPV